jgi:hypothetical protein
MSVSVKQDSGERWWSRYWFGIGLAAVILFSGAIRLYQIRGFSGEYDEGAHLMVAWLLSKGYSLYSEVGTNQLPFLYQPTAWLFAVGGPSSVLARWLEVGYALLGIIVVAGIGRLLWRPSVGLIAALFLSLEIYYFRNSRIFGGSVASAAVGGLAVLGALYYQKTGSRKLLVLTGVVFSFSLFVKPLSLFAGFLLLWAVIARRWRETSDVSTDRWSWFQSFPWRGLLADCLYLGMGMLAVLLLCLILYDEGAIVSRMIDCRLATKVYSSRGSVYLARILIGYVRVNLPLFVLAAMGTIVAIRRRDGSGLWVITWLGLSLVLILIWRAHSHHLLILSFPLALLAAYPLGELGDFRAVGRLRLMRWSSVIVILCLGYWLGTLILGWQRYFSVAPRGLDRPDDNDRWAAVSLLQQVTTAAQFVVSDDLSIPFEARRMVVPQLADVSSESIGCGLVTQEMVMQVADRDGSAFIFWTNRFLDEFPVLPFWTPVAYGGRNQFDEGHIVYYEKQTAQIANPLSVTFGKVIALEGYKLSADAPSQLTLFWRRLSADAVDYKITLRLLNSEGGVVAQYDDQPYSGFFPITAWPVGVLLPEELTLPSTDVLPPGEYTLVIGLYDLKTLELLTAEGATGENYDLVLLEMLRLGEY